MRDFLIFHNIFSRGCAFTPSAIKFCHAGLSGHFFIWGGVAAAGAALVFLKKSINQKLLDAMLGLAAGVMIAASFLSLLNPGGGTDGEDLLADSGALFVLMIQPVLPYALCFAAGAMIFVVVEQLIPESQRINANIDLVTMTGF